MRIRLNKRFKSSRDCFWSRSFEELSSLKKESVILSYHSNHLSEHKSVDGGEEGCSLSGGLGGPIENHVVSVNESGVFFKDSLFKQKNANRSDVFRLSLKRY